MPIVHVTYGSNLGDDALTRLAEALPHAVALAVACLEEPCDHDLQPGDVVQVFATYGSDGGSPTLLLSAEAEVVGTSSLDDTVTSSGEITVKLAVASAEERSAILNAKVTGQISLVRVSGAKAPGATERFEPDVPGAGASTGTTTPEEEGDPTEGSSGGG